MLIAVPALLREKRLISDHAASIYRLTVIAALCICFEALDVRADETFPATEIPNEEHRVERFPLRIAAIGGAAKTLFERVSSSTTGIDLVHQFPAGVPFEYLQDHGCATGVAIADYDNDGEADIYITNYDKGSRLYRNLGNWRFEDVTAKAGVSANGRWCSGSTFVDVDNDQKLDLFVAVFNGPNLLFMNKGDGTFEERGAAAGLDHSGASVMMAFADYDADGLLDGYLVTNRKFIGTDHRLPRNSAEAVRRGIIQKGPSGQPEITPQYADLFDLISKGQGHFELMIAGEPDRFYRNIGAGKFSLVNHLAGIRGNEIGLAATWWDYNSDGRWDLYVSNDYKGTDRLWRNDGGGKFTDVTRAALPHVAWASMGTDLGDVNNDGRLDLMTTDMAASSHERHMLVTGDLDEERWFLSSATPPQYRRNAFYLNTGTSNVFEIACLAGLEATDWTWSPKFADFDNDGWVDLFVSNGMSRDFMNSDLLRELKGRGHAAWRGKRVLKETNFAFRNGGDLSFESVAKDWGVNLKAASFGAAVADLDRDGDMDLVVTQFEEPVAVYRNNSGSGNRVLIRLKGIASNSYAVGATLRAETSADTQTRTISLTSGFMSANEPIAHFGLGNKESINRLRIEWPSGIRQTLTNLPAGHFYTINEPTLWPEPAAESASRPPPLFSPMPISGTGHTNQADQISGGQLPSLFSASQWGPGIAVGDVNGDGFDDVFVGGGADQPATLYLSSRTGELYPQQVRAFETDRSSNDTGALLIDIDGDDDLDLFVVSGESDVLPDHPSLKDRVYINDGRGNFSSAPARTLPDIREPGTVASAADFDRDGDLDIFIGGYNTPARYPGQMARSRLLRNEGGYFTDATETSGLADGDLRFATGALWSDVDTDGWVDLLVTQHWGPVKLFQNRRAVLKNATSEAFLAEKTGLWNGIAGADLNRDGVVEYIVSNWGLNNPRRLAPSTPIVAFLGDPMNSGQEHLIPCYYRGEVIYPLASRDEMIGTFPSLSEKFPTFSSYAAAPVTALFPSNGLAKMARLQATTLASSILVNTGKSQFRTESLPRLAQVAPAFGIAVSQFAGDERPDIFVAHNFSHAHPEIGRLGGGLSLVLLGGAELNLQPVFPDQSGIVIPQDARGAVVCDLNNDGVPDLLVARNNGELIAFKNAGENKQKLFKVSLRGPQWNRTAIGGRIVLKTAGGVSQAAEIYAGSGYLSQSSEKLIFGVREGDAVKEVDVFWPNGKHSNHSVDRHSTAVVLEPPTEL